MSETRRIAAILVADVAGYSRLAGATKIESWRGCDAAQRSDRSDNAGVPEDSRIVFRIGIHRAPLSRKATAI
jgi:hypothetical protein